MGVTGPQGLREQHCSIGCIEPINDPIGTLFYNVRIFFLIVTDGIGDSAPDRKVGMVY